MKNELNRALVAKKKLFTLLLALVASVGTMFASNMEVDGIWYDFDWSTQTASVTYQGYSYDDYSDEYSGTVTIPASVTYNGTTYSVTSIGESAFYYCIQLTAVTIPNSVTSIGSSAFSKCSGLTSITIPNSITSIGRYAFNNCSGLTSVTIPDSVTSIGDGAFYNCSGLTSITIPNSVTSIGDYAFSDCTGLTSVTIPNSITSIGRNAFSYCSGLTSIEIPNSVTSIGESAFFYCTGLTSIEIPNSVTSIGFSAFHYCSGLTHIDIPNSVTNIGNYAFYGCSVLTSITIPNSVTSIGSSAFQRCSALTSVTCEAVTPPTAEFGIFGECPELAHIYVPAESVEAYKTATNWSVYEAIIEAIRPSWLKEGDEWDEATKTLTVNSNPGEGAYAYITEIEHVIISEGVTSIAREAFYYCSALTTIELPASIESIGDYAFQGCPAIVSVTCKALNPPTMGDGIFYDSSALEHIYVPAWSVDAYKEANEWSINASVIEPIPGTEAIGHTVVNTHATKCIENGQLIILQNGQRFNAAGAQVK